MKQNIYRHGDILLKEISELPKTAKEKQKSKSYVLALGETTGHKHVITTERPDTLVEIFTDTDGKSYLRIGAQSKLTHEEHHTITVLPGIYEVGHEQEYDPFERATRQVVD